ncbi:cupin domain-containing protein [Dyadobacter flavalbus]|nr:cupin domain-containing protein [Dyadobacter flavalbus]
MQRKLVHILFLLIISMNANAQQAVARKDLLAVTFDSRAVDNVQAKEITMGAAQRAPLHRHPCPVVGYITEGTLIYQIQGQPAQTLNKGDAFYEPAETEIARFDNASASAPLKFIVFYLSTGEQPLIEILTKASNK